jgi:GMP reductase
MKNLKSQFDFDDVLIVPKVKTHISSRYSDIILPRSLPLFTAPMDTVVDTENMFTFMENDIRVTLPRTIKHGDYHLVPNGVFVSMGFEDIDFELKTSLRNLNRDLHVVIDVANGHMQKVFDYCREIKRLRKDIVLMVGNIGNPETYEFYAKGNCVDYIRVGIGNGGGCLTTKQSGVGYPMASLIHETYLVKQRFIESNNIDIKHKNTVLKTKPVDIIPKIVADGGMKDYSDIIKALGLGADYVMIGSIFNKALESCAQNYLYGFKISNKFAARAFKKGRPVKKHFRGMSTKGAQKAMGKTSFKTSEGVTRFRRVEYHLSGWVENFEHYLRNAMSYSNAQDLDEFIGGVEFCQITTKAYDRFNK